jgi:anti-sigma factor RsiW
MSCNSYDWKAYALGELDAKERRAAESHASTCSACREDLAATRLTLDAMSTLREEEIPRRIAFVSDKVFEPRWWQSFLRPSFAAGCVIAAAILVHAFVRPPAPDEVAMQARIDRTLAQMEQQQTKQMEMMVSTLELIEKQNRLTYARNVGLIRQ